MPVDYAREPLVLDHERLFEEVERLEDIKVITLDGMTAYIGKHPLYGLVNIVSPAIGSGLMFVSSNLGVLALLLGAPLVQIFLSLPISSLSIA